MMKRMERSKSWTSDYWKEFSDCLNSVLVKHFVTTCVICDHTCWPQWLPQMLFRGCFRAILIVLSLSFSLCVCLSVFVRARACARSQLLPTLWVGHRAASGEGQEDSAEDQTLQDKTSTEGTLLCRCKAVGLCTCGHIVYRLSVPFSAYFGHLVWAGVRFHSDLSFHMC